MALDIEQLNKLLENATGGEAIKNVINQITVGVKALDQSIERLVQQYGASSRQVQEAQAKKAQWAATLKSAEEKLGDVAGAFAKMSTVSVDATSESGKGLQNLLKRAVELGNGLTSSIMPAIKQNLALFGIHKSAWVRDLINPGKDFRRLSQGMFKGINEGLRNLLDVQNIARVGFMALGAGIDVANRKAEALPQLMRQSALSMNMTKEELKKYNEAVKFVPGALDAASDKLLSFMGLQQQQVQVSALAQVAIRGWGLTGQEGAQMQNRAFLQLNRRGERYIQMLGEMHGAIKSGIIPTNTAAQQIMSANDALGIFGDKAGLATNVWKTFAESLTAGGVAANQVGEIVKQVTANIAGMSVQNRAFISMMSGMFRGATALGGALRLEFAMRGPGGLEQNLEALTSSLARFGGGQILTLEQAANNPQLEMQFVLQRQMLGKLAGITTTEQQNRVLEVLQGVQRGGISRVEGSRELGDMMKRGGNVQQNTLTAIERVERVLADQIHSTLNNMAGNLENNLSVFQRIGGLQPGQTDVYRQTATGQMGQGPAIFSRRGAGGAGDVMRRGARMFGEELRKFFRTGLRGGPNERGQAMRAIPSRTMIQSVVNSTIRTLGAALAGRDPRRVQQLPRAGRPAQTPTAAIIPGAAPGTPQRQAQLQLNLAPLQRASQQLRRAVQTTRRPDLPAAIRQRPQATDERLVQTLTELNTTLKNLQTSPAVVESLRRTTTESPTPGTTPAAAPGAPAAPRAEVTSKTESTITIKVDTDDEKVRKAIMKTLADEVPKYINGERP